MIHAEAAAAATQFSWPTIAAPIAVVIAAGIAGLVATRNGRKSPHENLKMLVDIRAELDSSTADGEPSLDAERVVDSSIRTELAKLKKLNTAHGRGRFAYFREWLSQASPGDIGYVALQAFFALVGVLTVVNLFHPF